MDAKKPEPPPKVAPPVTLDDENVKNKKQNVLRKAGSTSRAQTNILKTGYGSGKQTLG